MSGWLISWLVREGGSVNAIGQPDLSTIRWFSKTRFAFLSATGAFTAFLHWRTRHRAVRAEDAAIACERLQCLAAALADVEELAGVGWHLLDGSMVALRAGECGLELHRWLAGTVLKKALAHHVLSGQHWLARSRPDP
jgi:hypothetical protein